MNVAPRGCDAFLATDARDGRPVERTLHVVHHQQRDAHLDASDIAMQLSNGEMTLTGLLPTVRTKARTNAPPKRQLKSYVVRLRCAGVAAAIHTYGDSYLRT